MIRRALLVLTLIAAASSPALAAGTSAGLFNLPEHLEKLKLDKPGSNGWRGTLAMTAKPGCIFYPGEPVNIDIALQGIGNGKLTVEVVSIGFDFAGFGGSAGGPRMHYMPRIIPKEKYDGVPPGARAVVKKMGDDVIYEIALPLADMKALTAERLAPGRTVNLTFNLPGSGVQFGEGRSATHDNGLTLLPRWAVTRSNSIAWGVAQ